MNNILECAYLNRMQLYVFDMLLSLIKNKTTFLSCIDSNLISFFFSFLSTLEIFLLLTFRDRLVHICSALLMDFAVAYAVAYAVACVVAYGSYGLCKLLLILMNFCNL